MFYRRLTFGVNDKGKLISTDESLDNHVKRGSPFKDYYLSIYKYNQDQFDEFEKKGTIAGITDLVTDQLVFDFDHSENPELAIQDAKTLINTLKKHDIDEEDIRVFFSGNKGIHVIINLTEDLTPASFKAITKQLANGLQTFDSVVANPSRILRGIGSVHKTSGLFKIPLTVQELNTLTLEEIKSKARSWDNVDKSKFKWKSVSLPSSIIALKSFKEEYKPISTPIETSDVDWSNKPKQFTNCRWALYNGHFKEGERNNALLCLAATFKNQGDNESIAYRRLKGVAETQSQILGTERYSDNLLYNTIIKVVYDDNWRNGQFTCRDKANWLYDYCQSLGHKKCNHKEEDQLKPKKLSDIQESFKHYVVNIDKNTIKTGIKSLDEKVFLSTGANVSIIGSAGSGKTSLALDIVSNTSKAGVCSVLASLDMHYNRLFEKALYRVSGLDRTNLYDLFKNDQEEDVMKKLQEEFGNVNFFHKSCPTVSDLREYILACQEHSGEKIKLVVLDYFERITSDLNEETAASKRVAGELQDLVNDLDICLVTLVQPNKVSLSGGPDSPILNYTSIKGSSYLYQSFRIIISLWRPFYNPDDFSNDRFMQMAVLKNDLGELAKLDFKWEGKRGLIKELEDSEYMELQKLLKEKSLNAEKEIKGFT